MAKLRLAAMVGFQRSGDFFEVHGAHGIALVFNRSITRRFAQKEHAWPWFS
jgi:hypothetical protein